MASPFDKVNALIRDMIENNVVVFQKAYTLDMVTPIARDTPVDTGRATAGWRAGINKEPTANNDLFDKTPAATPTINRLRSDLSDLKFGDEVIIRNAAEDTNSDEGGYIVKLESGPPEGSNQAPNGMFIVNVMRYKQIARKTKEKDRLIMSVDTITRINAYFKANIADTYPIYTIYKNVNEDLPEPASGPFVNLWVESSLDTLLTDGGNYQEDGIVIAQIYIEEGESSLELHSISDAIKIAFRQLQLAPTGGEVGTIAIEDIEPANRGTVRIDSYGSNMRWRRWDVFLTYSKYECN